MHWRTPHAGRKAHAIRAAVIWAFIAAAVAGWLMGFR